MENWNLMLDSLEIGTGVMLVLGLLCILLLLFVGRLLKRRRRRED
ncbi:LPXTG cell wall anchor domain-containing protein [Gramella sp. BOM4]|nr:LPXTG cell wall anchor domain-containing protein [Christiangramia bathymodioli]